jgi:hypothetical protein
LWLLAAVVAALGNMVEVVEPEDFAQELVYPLLLERTTQLQSVVVALAQEAQELQRQPDQTLCFPQSLPMVAA